MTENSRSHLPSRHAGGPIRVLLVDDHPLIRQGVRLLLGNEADMVVCGEAVSRLEALKQVEATSPDVALIDLSLEDSSGLDLIKDLKVRYPRVRSLVLSMRDESFYAERALSAGAMGYVTKKEGSERIVEGIRRVLQGEVYVSDGMASRFLRRLASGMTDGPAMAIERLTDRELQVLELIGQGVPTREISRRLHISPKTVDSHREHIKEKLSLRSAPELLKYAVEWVQCQGNV